MIKLFQTLTSIIIIFAMTQVSLAYTSEALKGAKKDIESFKQEMAIKLETVEKQLEELQSKTKLKSAEIQDNTVKDLEHTRDKLRTQLNGIEDSSKGNWKKIKKDFAESIDALHGKLQKALKD